MIAWLLACNAAPTNAELDQTRGGRIDAYFNDPGTNNQNMWYPDVVDLMIETVDNAQSTIDFAVMGFSYDDLIDAFIRAHDRGVTVRMVGDAGHWYNDGYTMLRDRQIPMVTGNLNHIMHDKFMVVDGRFVLCSTANWTDTDLLHNSNNFVTMDSSAVAADFTAEFEQMFGGKFGHTKEEVDNGRVYQLGDTEVEVWFSPNEDAMGRILELLEEAQESIRFTIFAFTKDQVGSAFIRKQEEFDEHNLAAGLEEIEDLDGKHTVAGVVDQSQLHSNGQYHEVYRLMAAGVPMRLDGNDNSRQPGDYQAGGGRMHSKTMVIDAYGDNPVVISGSFNWSASATVSNDEFLLVMKGPRVAEMYDDYFRSAWNNGRTLGETFVSTGDVEPGDVVINEVMWYGVNSKDQAGNDEFIELFNRTDETLDLKMWQITNAEDFVLGLPPGTVIGPQERYVIVDHVLEPYEDGAPQDENTGYTTADMVVNTFNDNRQSRLYLKDGNLELRLQDPEANIVDYAGDGGPAFTGGPEGDDPNVRVRSMERNEDDPGDGREATSWYAYRDGEGVGVVNPEMTDELLASPGETNSAP